MAYVTKIFLGKVLMKKQGVSNGRGRCRGISKTESEA
jgi:hypothetical protein